MSIHLLKNIHIILANCVWLMYFMCKYETSELRVNSKNNHWSTKM